MPSPNPSVPGSERSTHALIDYSAAGAGDDRSATRAFPSPLTYLSNRRSAHRLHPPATILSAILHNQHTGWVVEARAKLRLCCMPRRAPKPLESALHSTTHLRRCGAWSRARSAPVLSASPTQPLSMVPCLNRIFLPPPHLLFRLPLSPSAAPPARLHLSPAPAPPSSPRSPVLDDRL